MVVALGTRSVQSLSHVRGQFCPWNLPCTIACVPGAQCQLSVLNEERGRCEYPSIMAGAESSDPLVVLRTQGQERDHYHRRRRRGGGRRGGGEGAALSRAMNMHLCESGHHVLRP